jgi:hypothetical protein
LKLAWQQNAEYKVLTEDEIDEVTALLRSKGKPIGGGLDGYINISFAELLNNLGYPTKDKPSIDNKVDVEWIIWFPQLEEIVWIYNFKNGPAYIQDPEDENYNEIEDITHWNIAGRSRALQKVKDFILPMATFEAYIEPGTISLSFKKIELREREVCISRSHIKTPESRAVASLVIQPTQL